MILKKILQLPNASPVISRYASPGVKICRLDDSFFPKDQNQFYFAFNPHYFGIPKLHFACFDVGSNSSSFLEQMEPLFKNNDFEHWGFAFNFNTPLAVPAVSMVAELVENCSYFNFPTPTFVHTSFHLKQLSEVLVLDEAVAKHNLAHIFQPTFLKDPMLLSSKDDVVKYYNDLQKNPRFEGNIPGDRYYRWWDEVASLAKKAQTNPGIYLCSWILKLSKTLAFIDASSRFDFEHMDWSKLGKINLDLKDAPQIQKLFLNYQGF